MFKSIEQLVMRVEAEKILGLKSLENIIPEDWMAELIADDASHYCKKI
jgi:hypothetical protein